MYGTRLANQLNLDPIDIDVLAIETIVEMTGSTNEIYIKLVDNVNQAYTKLVSSEILPKSDGGIDRTCEFNDFRGYNFWHNYWRWSSVAYIIFM